MLAGESSLILSASTSFKQRLELDAGVSGDKAVIARFSAGLAVAISSTLNWTVGLVDSCNSRPPPGNKRNDRRLCAGISVEFGAL